MTLQELHDARMNRKPITLPDGRRAMVLRVDWTDQLNVYSVRFAANGAEWTHTVTLGTQPTPKQKPSAFSPELSKAIATIQAAIVANRNTPAKLDALSDVLRDLSALATIANTKANVRNQARANTLWNTISRAIGR